MTASLRARNVTRTTGLADRLEVADGLWDRFMGLMGRSSLASGTGMWLTGTNGIHMFFMHFAIDAVFLGRPDPAADGARPVVSIHPGLRAWIGMVPFVRGAHGVLELPVGTIARSGTVVGDRIALEPADLHVADPVVGDPAIADPGPADPRPTHSEPAKPE
jgi:uncharacterized membrane protein (UPF0127 family)